MISLLIYTYCSYFFILLVGLFSYQQYLGNPKRNIKRNIIRFKRRSNIRRNYSKVNLRNQQPNLRNQQPSNDNEYYQPLSDTLHRWKRMQDEQSIYSFLIENNVETGHALSVSNFLSKKLNIDHFQKNQLLVLCLHRFGSGDEKEKYLVKKFTIFFKEYIYVLLIKNNRVYAYKKDFKADINNLKKFTMNSMNDILYLEKYKEKFEEKTIQFLVKSLRSIEKKLRKANYKIKKMEVFFQEEATISEQDYVISNELVPISIRFYVEKEGKDLVTSIYIYRDHSGTMYLLDNNGTSCILKKFNISKNASFESYKHNGKLPISRNYGMRRHPIKKRLLMHGGIDISIPRKSKVFSSEKGWVFFSGYRKGYGYCVIICHYSNIFTLYAHLDKIAVATGDVVHAGQIVGLVGSTGLSTGPHLHYEVRKLNVPINSMMYMSMAQFFSQTCTVNPIHKHVTKYCIHHEEDFKLFKQIVDTMDKVSF